MVVTRSVIHSGQTKDLRMSLRDSAKRNMHFSIINWRLHACGRLIVYPV